MKRLFLFVAVLLLTAPAAYAQRDVLLGDDGTVYASTIEWAYQHPEVKTNSSTYLVLTVNRTGHEPQRLLIPETLQGGSNTNPALAYDTDSATLFVFWQHWPNAMSTELRFVAYHRETGWTNATSFEKASYRLRRNLRIALTSFAADKDEEKDELTWVPEINVHATWWEETGSRESARYAMITVRHGEASIQVHDLATFVKAHGKPADVEPDFSPEILRHPAIFESADEKSVDVVFGDVQTNSFHRVRISPIGNARVRIPVGAQARDFAPPAKFAANFVDRIDAISPLPDRLVFFFQQGGLMRYLVHRDGSWSEERAVKIDEVITREKALAGIRRLVGAQ